MIDLQQRFARIKAFYREKASAICAARDDWGIDPYAWEEAGIVLTPIEAGLWHDIRAESLVLYPQYPVGRFFVDFGNPVWKVAIECDGKRWHTDHERDQRRQAEIEAMGWRVYRIGGAACLTDAVESEAENGPPRLEAGAARVFIRDVVAQEPQLVRSRARRVVTN